MKTLGLIVLAVAVLASAVGAFAQDTATVTVTEGENKVQASVQPPVQPPPAPLAPEERVPMAKALAIVGACLGAGLCAVGGGFGIARIGGNCIESIARQPEAAGPMFTPMIITAAMVEGGMLFAIVVCMLGVLFI